MEKNATNNLAVYVTCISAAKEASLYIIRHWKNLSVAFDGDMV
jgi:hypothetical protein